MTVKTYTLKHPIEIKSKDSGEVLERITQLEFKRPNLRAFRAMDKADGEIGKIIAFVAAITNQPPAVIDEIDGEDLMAITEVVKDFFGSLPPIGGTFSG